MLDKKAKTKEESVKLREFARILRASEEFLVSTSDGNKNLVLFIKEFRRILKPYGNMDGTRILKALKQSLEDYRAVMPEVRTLLSNTNVEFISFGRLKNLVIDEKTSKKDLLLLAEKRLGIPIGALKSMKIELIRDRILSEIENIEKFDTIKRKAAE